MGKKHRPVDEIKDFVAPRAELVRRSVCSLHFLWETTKTIGLVLFYYVFSISLTFYNQRFIHMYRFPLSITMCHLVTKFIISGIIRCIWSKCSGEERISLGWCDFIKRIAPPGIASSLDIALSNWSFEYISISLYTMTKSTVIIFIMFFSIVFKLEKPRWSLISIIGCISLGLFMFTYDSTQFHLLGFLLVFSASFLSGLRWTLSQLVMQKSKLGVHHPLDMMYHIQPWMMLTLLPLAGGFEGRRLAISPHAFGFHESSLLARDMAILMLGAFLAFMLEMSEFLLVSKTSSLTLSISGIAKEIVTLCLAVVINKDPMSPINGIGLVVCLLGITIHVILKAVHSEDEKEVKYKRLNQEEMELTVNNGTIIIGSDTSDEDDVFNIHTDRQ